MNYLINKVFDELSLLRFSVKAKGIHVFKDGYNKFMKSKVSQLKKCLAN